MTHAGPPAPSPSLSRSRQGERDKIRIFRWATAILVFLALAGCGTGPRLERGRACAPDFPLQEGWLGGDGAASVDLGGGRSLWFFGDTFIGEPGARTREGAALIANSVALSRCAGGAPAIRYHWAETPSGPAPIFADPEPGIRVWPIAALLAKDTLLVTLLRVRTTDPESPLGFALEGVDLARIANWRDPPERWAVDRAALTRAADLVPGAGLLADETHLFLLMPQNEGDGRHRLLLARADWAAVLGSRAPALHVWAGAAAGWRPGLEPAAAVPLAAPVPVEMSLHMRGQKALLVAGGPFGDPGIYLRRAPALEGPWSATEAVAQMPEADLEGVFCYAGKAHFQFRVGARVLATYACNATDPARLLRDLTLYRPRAIWIRPGL